jgi:hypothetical protein
VSIMKRSAKRWCAVALSAAAAISLQPAGPALGAEPAARLLPPQPAAGTMISRGAGEDERDASFQFPAPDNKPGVLDFFGLLSRSESTEEGPRLEQAAVADANGHYLYNQPAVGPVRTQGAAVLPPPMPPPEAPAWRWYGYGAPVPGRNPYAPEGFYAPVHPNYYYQTGATPGAIPRPLQPPVMMQPQTQSKPSVPTLPPPLPTTAEPPRLMQGPSLAPATSGVDNIDSNVRPVKMDAPVPVATPISSRSWKPLSALTPLAVVRAQAPEESPVEALAEALRSRCTGYATRIELQPRGPSSYLLRLTPAPGARADALAERIASLPELNGCDVEMEFVRAAGTR